MSKNKTCPILKSKCIKEDCEWYDQIECAVHSAAGTGGTLLDMLEELEEIREQLGNSTE